MAFFLTQSTEDRKWVVSVPPSSPKPGQSSLYVRNPIYEETRDALKEVFDEGTLVIYPYQVLSYKGKAFDLRDLGYDVCEVNTKYRGFKSDLLLYRSNKKNKGAISIDVRGRRRREDFRHPEDLRVIDIILKYDSLTEDVKSRWKSGDLFNTFGETIYYTGFKYRYRTGLKVEWGY